MKWPFVKRPEQQPEPDNTHVSSVDRTIAELLADAPVITPGDRVEENAEAVGRRYADGSYHPDPMTDAGYALVARGVEYVCKHGIAARSRMGRAQHCPDCKQEYLKSPQLEPVSLLKESAESPQTAPANAIRSPRFKTSPATRVHKRSRITLSDAVEKVEM